jgi:probable HAF family extracellular repeat protein
MQIARSHAVRWQNGKVTDLGNFGGTPNEAYGINDLGQVVGYSTLSDGVTEHAFLWQAGVMTDLGTLPGDVGSHAAGTNFEGQVVGWSFDADGNDTAFLWQNGVMTDLNTLIPADSYLYLLFADGINVWGQIAGTAYDINTGEEHAYLAIPNSYKGMNEPATERPKVTLPENVRQQLKRRMRLGRLQGGMVTSR